MSLLRGLAGLNLVVVLFFSGVIFTSLLRDDAGTPPPGSMGGADARAGLFLLVVAVLSGLGLIWLSAT